MQNFEHWARVEFTAGVSTVAVPNGFFSRDNKSAKLGIRCFYKSEPYIFTNTQHITWFAKNSDGVTRSDSSSTTCTVAVGTNEAYVELPEAALVVGPITVALRLEESPAKQVVAVFTGYVHETATAQEEVPPWTPVPDIQELMAEIATMEAVVDEAQEITQEVSAHFPDTGRFVVGTGSTVSSDNSASIGLSNAVTGPSAQALGSHTIANHAGQHVFGAYNVADPSSNSSAYRGNYVEIVGNGLTDESRSNARTLDWNGNEVLAGTITAAGVDLNNEIGSLKSASNSFWSVNKEAIDWVRGSINSADGTENNTTNNKRIRCRTSAIMIEDQIIIADDASRFYVYFYHGTPSSSTFDGHTGGWIRLCNISSYASEHYPNADRFRIVGSMADNGDIGDGVSTDVSACTDHIYELCKYATASESAQKFGYVRVLNDSDTLDSIYAPGAYRWTSSNKPIDSPTAAGGFMFIYGPSNDNVEGKAAIVISSAGTILVRGSSSQGWGRFITHKAIELDDSLSVSEMAADSKVVGDALSNVNEALAKKYGYVRVLNSSDSIDTIFTPGAYRWTSSNRPTDLPIAQPGSMLIYGPPKDNVEGKTCIIVANGRMLSRFSTSTGWLPWIFYENSDLIYDMPKSLGAYNCIMRVKQLSSIQYQTKSILPNQDNDIPADNDVTGIPYSSSRYENLYVPVCVSFDTFMTAAMNPNSYLYTRVSSIGDGVTLLGNSKTYYGNVCSSLVSYCLGFEDIIYTTHQIGELSAFRLLDDQNCYALELGDVILNPDDHIVVVTEIARAKKGKIKYVEITEAWPPFCRSRHYSVDQMNQKYFNNPDKPNCKAYRYNDIGSITYTPSPWVPLDDETGTPVYNHHLSPRRGDKAVWMPGEDIEIDITDVGSYTAYKLYKDETLLSTQQISGVLITLSSLSYGKYKLCLTDGSNDSDFVYWIVIDEPQVSAQYLGNRKVRATFSCRNAEATNIAWCSAGTANNYRHLYAVRSTTRLTESEKQAGVVENTFEGNDWDTIVSEANGKCYIRFMWKTEYGYYSRNYTEINLM